MTDLSEIEAPVLILGAGPAGLTAAYELSKNAVSSVLLEKDSSVGGLSRTVEYKGHRFDIGGHRFYTKIPMVEEIWHEVLGKELLIRPRLSRIYYKAKFFHYPIDPLDALRGLGLLESVRCCLSLMKSRLFPRVPEHDFETWVANRFGRQLFEIFFKTYTEKVWGINCREIQADWAAQRIAGLSLMSILGDAILPRRSRSIRTLIKHFQYPRLGPGMMWSRVREIVEERGSHIRLNSPVEKVMWEKGRVIAVRSGGRVYRAKHFISSIPIRELIEALDPVPPEALRRAACDFHYRDFITVALIVRGRNLFPDNWIYIHDPGLSVGRIQNYNNWSADMTSDPEMTCLGLEYFCFEGDRYWNAADDELIGMAKKELAQLGLAKECDVVDGTVVRVAKAYPIYDSVYKQALGAVRDFLRTVPNLQLIGRNGMHRYNNQDHSMLTGILASRNILGGHFDLWSLTGDMNYLEQGHDLTEEQVLAFEESQPAVPRPV
ncbi:MAG: NAD(P)/FAD-dependent oxidoreductase [Bryobacteraceae bacterium]